MGRIESQVKANKKTKEAQDKFVETLIWYTNAMNELIAQAILEINNLNEALNNTLDEVKGKVR